MPEPVFVPGLVVNGKVGGDAVPSMEYDVLTSVDVLPTKQHVYETPR